MGGFFVLSPCGYRQKICCAHVYHEAGPQHNVALYCDHDWCTTFIVTTYNVHLHVYMCMSMAMFLECVRESVFVLHVPWAHATYLQWVLHVHVLVLEQHLVSTCTHSSTIKYCDPCATYNSTIPARVHGSVFFPFFLVLHVPWAHGTHNTCTWHVHVLAQHVKHSQKYFGGN